MSINLQNRSLFLYFSSKWYQNRHQNDKNMYILIPLGTPGPQEWPLGGFGSIFCRFWTTFGPFGRPFWEPLGTLGPFWSLRTSKMRGFFDHPVLGHILHRFWALWGGGRHAIRSCLCMFAKGRPFSKRYYFEVHLEVILEPKRGPESQLYSRWVPWESFWGLFWRKKMVR